MRPHRTAMRRAPHRHAPRTAPSRARMRHAAHGHSLTPRPRMRARAVLCASRPQLVRNMIATKDRLLASANASANASASAVASF